MKWVRHIGWSLEGFLVTVVLVTAAFWIMPREYERQVDPYILILLTIGFALASGVVIWATDVWTPRGLGVLGGLLGDACLYFSLLLGRFWANDYWTEHLRDLARGFFMVGVPLLIYGLLRYVEEEKEIFDNLTLTWRRRLHLVDVRDRQQDERDLRQNERDLRQNEREVTQDARDRA